MVLRCLEKPVGHLTNRSVSKMAALPFHTSQATADLPCPMPIPGSSTPSALPSATATATASLTPRRERRKQARPGELLDAALDLFVERGYAATRVEAVAARAGVSKGTLFLYFPSKQALFKAVVRENIAGRFDGWNAEFEQFRGSTSDMLRLCFQSWWQHIGATRASGITKLVLSEAGNFPEISQFYQREVIAPGQRLVRRVLERGMDCGEFQVRDLDYAVHAVLAPMVFLSLCQHSGHACMHGGGGFSPQRYIDTQVDILLGGLCAAPHAPRKSAASPLQA